MNREAIENKIAHFALRLISSTLFRAEYSAQTLRRRFEWTSAVSAKRLARKFPEAQFTPLHLGGVPAESIQTSAHPKRTLLYLHGGGYFMGSIESYRRTAMRIAHRTNAKVLLLGYRLAPEYPHPAALEDARAAYLELIKTTPWEEVFIVGDSAGGGLTLATLLWLRDRGERLPKGAVAICPWADLTGSIADGSRDVCLSGGHTIKWSSWYVGNADPKTPYISPSFGDYSGLPPILFFAGESDILFNETQFVANKALQAGVKVHKVIGKNMQHDWFLVLPHLVESKRAMALLADFIKT